MSSTDPIHGQEVPEDDFLAAEDVEEILEDPDHPVEDDGDDNDEGDEEIQLVNDSAAHFDTHTDSIFCIAQHPTKPAIVVTGGGDDVAYIFDSSIPEGPVLPASYESSPQARGERQGLKPIQRLDGHADSVNAVTFTQPAGEFVVTAGLDGKLRAWHGSNSATQWNFVAETQEVEEINWVAAAPDRSHPNTIALGASDGSVWVYQITLKENDPPLTILQAYYLHTASCTAGAWSPDGTLLGTVAEDGSFYVLDVFGSGQAVVGLTAADQRFEVEGGLYSVALNSTVAAVGGAGGHIKVVRLPQSSSSQASTKSKDPKSAAADAPSSTGQILASLKAQTDGVETLSFSSAPLTLLAAGSVDGSIAIFDTAHRFAVRRHIQDAHDAFAVVKVEFVRDARKGGWLLTSCGMDGVVRRWDTRGGAATAVKEWRGHRGEGEGGGVLGFVQGETGDRVVTAGDDSVALVFRADV